VHPKIVPQFADAAEVATGALLVHGLVPSALVPNLKGAERAFEAGLTRVNYVVSASDAHNRANVGRPTAESVEDFGRITALARDKGRERFHIAAGIATAFGCTIAGAVPEAQVFAMAERLIELGADEIIVADTVGYGNPPQVRRIMARVLEIAGGRPVACHFHDTRGLGLANVTAAVEVGVRAFDASLGGLGGCPFAPGASGNINSEDCAYLLESLGLDTGIDIPTLVKVRQTVEPWLPGENFTGSIARAGLPKTFRDAA
jgi:hydroxymethylglutaryl-CoA lyase